MSFTGFHNPVHVKPVPRLDMQAECTDLPSEGLHLLDQSSSKILASSFVLGILVNLMHESNLLVLNIADIYSGTEQ